MAGGGHRSGFKTRTSETAGPLAGALESLVALESRIQSLEDTLTSGDALALPEPPRPRVRKEREPSLDSLEASLLVGTLVRRMNLRLGAIERALNNRVPLGLEETLPLRAPRRLKALDALSAERSDSIRLRGSPFTGPPKRAN